MIYSRRDRQDGKAALVILEPSLCFSSTLLFKCQIQGYNDSCQQRGITDLQKPLTAFQRLSPLPSGKSLSKQHTDNIYLTFSLSSP